MVKKGVLITNLGSPSSLSKSSLRRYLREFLSDPRVIDINPIARYILVNFIIAPFRPKKIVSMYSKIWTDSGSPLLVNTKKISESLQVELGPAYEVIWAMRYGKPTLEEALRKLSSCSEIIVLPLYPQYATSSTGSTLTKISEISNNFWDFPKIKFIHNFYDHPDFIKSTALKITQFSKNFKWDHILYSYHGIPQRHLIKSDCKQMKNKKCVHLKCPQNIENETYCYRFQCYKSSELISDELGLSSDQHSTTFQSRLGRTPWIKPYTDEYLSELYNKGVRNLLVTSPSFIADCLETIDEIGNRLREQWLEYKNTKFLWVPSLNDDTNFILAIKNMVTEDANTK